MKYNIFVIKHYKWIVLGMPVLLSILTQKSIAFAEYDYEGLSQYDIIYLKYVEHWEHTYYKNDPANEYYNPNPTKELTPYEESLAKNANMTDESTSTESGSTESGSTTPPGTPEPIPDNEDILEEFIKTINNLTANLEMHLKRAGDNKFLIVQAGERALDSFYPDMNTDEAMMLIQNLEGFNLSDFGSKETMSHLMTNLAIKARGGVLPNTELKLRAYQKAYDDTLELITETYYS